MWLPERVAERPPAAWAWPDLSQQTSIRAGHTEHRSQSQAQRASILVPRDHLHISQLRMFRVQRLELCR